jgi:hypothetical protein
MPMMKSLITQKRFGHWLKKVMSSCRSASSTTKTGRHDIAEALLKVALKTKNQSINLHPLCHQHLKKTTFVEVDLVDLYSGPKKRMEM